MPFDADPPAEMTARDRMIRLRDFLATLPDKQFNMGVWSRQLSCGTAACIGGWAEHLIFGEIDSERSERTVAAALGLSREQESELFYPDSYNRTTAEAVRVLDYYLATGEIRWDVA
jgi:hypothetical protein